MPSKILRYAICVYYDPDGELRPFMEYFLLSLKEFCFGILLVINGKITVKSKIKLSNLGVDILERENKGYDFQAYKEGYFHLKNSHLLTMDELIFCNSSCYGPITSLGKVFKIMDEKNVDFWGLTQWHSLPWPDHIQSYFLVFRKSIYRSLDFEKYWECLPDLHNRKEAIEKCEVLLTSYFAQKGYKWDTFIKPSRPDYSMTFVHEGLLSGLPVVKRKFFLLNRDDLEKKKVLSFILNKTKYNTELIYEDFFFSSYLSTSTKNSISFRSYLKSNYPRLSKFLIKIKKYL